MIICPTHDGLRLSVAEAVSFATFFATRQMTIFPP